MELNDILSKGAAKPGCPSDHVLDRHYLGELDEADDLKCREHLRECANCQKRLNERKLGFASWSEVDGSLMLENILARVKEDEIPPNVRRFIDKEKEKTSTPNVISLEKARKRRKKFIFSFAAASGIAAASMLFILLSSSPDPVMLPQYHLAMRSAVKEYRGESPAETVPRFTVDSFIELRAQPEISPGEAIESAIFVAQKGISRRIDTPIEYGPNGGLRVRVRLDKGFGLKEGSASLWIAISKSGHLPNTKALIQEIQKNQTGSYSWGMLVKREFQISPASLAR